MTDLPALYAARVALGRLEPDDAQLAVLPHLERVRAELAQPVKRGLFRKAAPLVRGLYLWGGVGRGKSMLMDLLAESAPTPLWRRHFHAFMQWVHDQMNRARSRGVEDPIPPVADLIIAEARLLCFDEVQITDITDAMLVGRLFQRLFDGGVTVVATSNRHPDDLYKDGLNRAVFLPFIALMKERMDVIELASPTDHRQGRLTGEQRYFTPADAAARAAVNAIWQRLTDGEAHPLVLRVKGHDVHIPGFHNGAARAGFFDLCGQPLGPADYLALASVAKVLVVEDIPQLGSENFNQARRFVTLIDALYEAKTKLICTAAARPEMLYVEGEGSFEFGRTASRLVEMQAEDWGR
jgi:cell division protein ZapE